MGGDHVAERVVLLAELGPGPGGRRDVEHVEAHREQDRDLAAGEAPSDTVVWLPPDGVSGWELAEVCYAE